MRALIVLVCLIAVWAGTLVFFLFENDSQYKNRVAECTAKSGHIIDDRGNPCYNLETGKRIFLSTDILD